MFWFGFDVIVLCGFGIFTIPSETKSNPQTFSRTPVKFSQETTNSLEDKIKQEQSNPQNQEAVKNIENNAMKILGNVKVGFLILRENVIFPSCWDTVWIMKVDTTYNFGWTNS